MFRRRLIMSAIFLFSSLSVCNAKGDAGLHALEFYPDEYPQGVAFYLPPPGQAVRISGRADAWYAVYQMPIYPGKAYDLLLAHDGDASRMRLYTLNGNPFERTSVRYELYMRKLEFGGKHNSVYGTTIATSPDSSAHKIYLLLEWLPSASNEMPVPAVLQVISSDPDGYMPEDRHGMYWSWHKEWQHPLNDLHVESPLQSEKRRNANDTQPPANVQPDRSGAPPYRLLPY
jgi:hypothetical protein